MTDNDRARLLLAYATAVLDGNAHVPAGQQTRAAAHLARQALEELVPQLCARLGAEIPHASMRSRLIVLHALAPPEWSRPAGAAWEGLSRACHRHAYELSPTHTEVRALIGSVTSLLPSASQSAT